MDLAVTLELLPTYLAGFPMPVGFVLTNPDPDIWYGELPYIDPLAAPGPISLEITAADQSTRWVPTHPPRHTESIGLAIDPLERQRYLLDLDQWTSWTAGEYQLRIHYMTPYFDVTSPSVRLFVRTPSSDDAQAARALVGPRFGRVGAWSDFILRPASPPELQRVSSEIRRLLALPLFVQRAVHGPAPIAELELDRLDAIQGGPLDAENLALRYELLAARGAREKLPLRTRMLAAWPGLAWRAREADDGSGLLESLRVLTKR